jgi:hypothetical protein
MMNEPIRLTNKTAMAIRRSAKRVRTAYCVAAAVVSVVLFVTGIVLGFLWLPAVPLMFAAIALIDAGLMVASRSHYLSLLGQAICTEAAAREIGAGRSEQRRRAQAARDLMEVKADLEAEMDKKEGAQPFFEAKAEEQEEEDDDLLPAVKKAEEAAPRRRRRENPLTLIRSEQVK